MTVTIDAGWKLFWRAWKRSRFGSLNEAAEWMYRLNVFARSIGRHPITDQIYSLKNTLIKYLYQRGYATEVVLHVQEFDCWGTYPFGCDDDCPKCGGTGIYRTEKLYGFRFEIEGKRYAWHQPGKLIDYPVELTNGEPAPYKEPERDHAILFLEGSLAGLLRGLVVAAGARRRGRSADLRTDPAVVQGSFSGATTLLDGFQPRKEVTIL